MIPAATYVFKHALVRDAASGAWPTNIIGARIG